jgi:hypothetical protein
MSILYLPFFNVVDYLQDILEELEVSGILSAESLPLRNIQPLATNFATEMTNLNVFGQTQLMLSQLKKKQQHYATLGIISKQGCERLEECISALKKEKQNLIVQEQAWEDWNRELKRKEEVVAAERKEIAEKKKNQAVAKLASKASGAKPKKDKQEVSAQQSLFPSSTGSQYRTPSVQPCGRSNSADTPVPHSRKDKVPRRPSGYDLDDESSPDPPTDEDEYATKTDDKMKRSKDPLDPEVTPVENDGLQNSA